VSQENIQQLLNILQSNSDISSCLSNCSNQGICKLSNNQTYICECNANFMGKSCQTDQRPCSQSNKCLNNGTCTNSQDLTSFTCKCQEGSPFYGQYCENMRNLCGNVTCSSHGHCIQNLNETKCKCFNGFKGDKCEIEGNTVKILQGIQWLSIAICIFSIVLFWLLVITSDVLDYFKIGDEHIDMDEWRHEKLHGEKKVKQNTKRLRKSKRNARRKRNTNANNNKNNHKRL
jgi:hypothetical protein